MAILLGLSDTGWVSWNPPRVLALAASLPLPQIHFHQTSTHLISPTRPPELALVNSQVDHSATSPHLLP